MPVLVQVSSESQPFFLRVLLSCLCLSFACVTTSSAPLRPHPKSDLPVFFLLVFPFVSASSEAQPEYPVIPAQEPEGPLRGSLRGKARTYVGGAQQGLVREAQREFRNNKLVPSRVVLDFLFSQVHVGVFFALSHQPVGRAAHPLHLEYAHWSEARRHTQLSELDMTRISAVWCYWSVSSQVAEERSVVLKLRISSGKM